MRLLFGLLLTVLLAAPLGAAEVFRWVDADGTVHYGDQPLDPEAEDTGLRSQDTDPAAVAARLEARRERLATLDAAAGLEGRQEERGEEWRAEQTQRCERARAWATKVANQPRLYETREDGSREVYDTERRAEVVRDAQAMVDRECSQL